MTGQAPPVHEPVPPEAIGVPYFRAVRGPDGRYWWAKCPRCGEVVENRDGRGPGQHWQDRVEAEAGAKIQAELRARNAIPVDVCVGCYLGDAGPSIHDYGYGCAYGKGAQV